MRFNVTIDCADPEGLAAFYAALMDLPVVFEGGAYVVLAAPVPGGANLIFQKVPDPTPGKAKAHLDVHSDGDVDGVCDKAVAMGATRGEDLRELDMHWRTMTDPEGNPFCISAAP